MDVDEALRQALEDAKSELDAAEQGFREAEARVDRARAEVQGLSLAVARRDGGDKAAADVLGASRAMVLNRTSAILRVLHEADEPLSPTEIASRLREFRTPRSADTARDVSAALSYLRRINSVASLGRGQWVLVRRDADGATEKGEPFDSP